jgi:hypothetical protein
VLLNAHTAAEFEVTYSSNLHFLVTAASWKARLCVCEPPGTSISSMSTKSRVEKEDNMRDYERCNDRNGKRADGDNFHNSVKAGTQS